MTTKNNVLEPVESKITVAVKDAFDPKEFFKDRKGLFVGSSFEERILDKAAATEAGKEFSMASFVLKESADDETIEAALPKEHLFSESDVCVVIAEMITKQPKGEEGDLLNTGSWNLFYTKNFVVFVRWRSRVRDWYVYAWNRDGGRWDGVARVFAPAN